MLDIGEHRTAYLIARDAALPTRDIYKTEQEFTAGWIALRFLQTRRPPRSILRASASAASTRPRWRAPAIGRAAPPKPPAAREARAAYTGGCGAIDQLLRPAGARQTRLAADRIERSPRAPRQGAERLEIVRAVQLLYQVNERDLAVPIFADMGENGDPDALVGLGELASRHGDARGMLLLGKAALNRGLPFDYYAYPVNGIPHFKPIGPEVERSVLFAITRQESAFNPSVVSPAHAYGLLQVTPDAGPLCLQEVRRAASTSAG